MLAAEIGTTPDTLVRKIRQDFYPEAVWETRIGFRCVSPEIATVVITEQRARDQAQRDREARMRAGLAARSTVPQVRARLKARADEQEAMHKALEASGVPLHEAALAVATEADRTKRTRKTRTNLEEQLSGRMVYHSVREAENE